MDLAEKGQTVDITNRGRLVARLVPAEEAESPRSDLTAFVAYDKRLLAAAMEAGLPTASPA